MAEKDIDVSKHSTMNNTLDHSSTASPEKPVEDITEDQYPHGFRLVLLAGATIIAVFLIALDQVSKHSIQSSRHLMDPSDIKDV